MLQRLLSTALVAAFLLIGGVFAAAPRVAAFDPLGSACTADAGKGNAAATPACQGGSSTPLLGPNGIFLKVAKIVAIIAGAAAVLMIVVAGLQYVTASGDPQKAATARKTILYALIGLIVIALAQTIITFVVSNID